MASKQKSVSPIRRTKHSTDDTFKDFVLDQLSDLPHLACRNMFGGSGLYSNGQFFGIVYHGRLFFKTNALSRQPYLAKGMQPFQPNKRQTLKTFYEVPLDILEDSDQLTLWAQRASGHRVPL